MRLHALIKHTYNSKRCNHYDERIVRGRHGHRGRCNVDDCDFGRYLTIIRLSRSLTQVELAERAGISVRCISDLERGINLAPRMDTIHLLIAGLGLDQAQSAVLRQVAACARLRQRFGDRDESSRHVPGI